MKDAADKRAGWELNSARAGAANQYRHWLQRFFTMPGDGSHG
jgi:hypothetical protein